MKFTVNRNTPPRRLVAVLGFKNGLYIRNRSNSGVTFVSDLGVEAYDQTLEFIAKDPARQPVYEGDTVEITF